MIRFETLSTKKQENITRFRTLIHSIPPLKIDTTLLLISLLISFPISIVLRKTLFYFALIHIFSKEYFEIILGCICEITKKKN